MSKFSKVMVRRAAGALAVAAVAGVGVASVGAGHAEAANLPNGHKTSSGVDGGTVEVWRTHESALPAPSMANNGAGRSAVTSGIYTAKLSKDLKGKLSVGYLVGCQVSLGDFQAGVSGTISSSPSLSGSLSFPLAPGEIKQVDMNSKDIDKGAASVQTSRVELDAQGCGGYAQARSFAKVVAAKGYNTDDGTVNGEGSYIQTTLYGKPFSLN